jgi:hypothetical protein
MWWRAMIHPIVALQSALVAALKVDSGLAGVGVFDAPVRGRWRRTWS